MVEITSEEQSKVKELRILSRVLTDNIEPINIDLEESKNKHTETSNTITEITIFLEGINSRICEGEE